MSQNHKQFINFFWQLHKIIVLKYTVGSVLWGFYYLKSVGMKEGVFISIKKLRDLLCKAVMDT